VTDFVELVGDFLNIEVNTIIKDSMSAEKFPPRYLDAVKQILKGYISYIGQLDSSQPLPSELEIEKFGNEFPAPSQSEFNRCWHKITASLKSLLCRKKTGGTETNGGQTPEAQGAKGQGNGEPTKRLKEVAEQLQKEASEKHKPILERIRTNCDLLEQIRAKDALEIGDRLAIRKMWEIGTEHVVIQTCISLGGDVTTRISSDLVMRDAEIRDMLLNAHRESTSISVAHWKSLLDAITAIADQKGGK
jgi:hypothetical protein